MVELVSVSLKRFLAMCEIENLSLVETLSGIG